MNNKKLLLFFFVLMVLAQLFVPAQMIFERENIIAIGKAYKFKVAPIDPNDPYRGKYISLQFEANSVPMQNDEWTSGEMIYVLLNTDNKGFAMIQSVSKTKPKNNKNFVKAKVNYANSDEVQIDYPFNRFYMEESKAPGAETVYRESAIDTAQIAYGLVYVKDGGAVLKDVLINEISIKEIVSKRNKK